MGINTSAPTATLDVNGTYKLGASGTVLTNVIKTTATVNETAFTGSKVATLTVTGATQNATVIVNPGLRLQALS